MDAQALYDELAGDAWKLAAGSTLDSDDIRQELYLMCLEVTEGRSAYTPMIGGVHEYIMGRLWGLVRRWPQSQSVEGLILEELVDSENSEKSSVEHFDILAALYAPSVEDVLEQRDFQYEQDAIDIEETRQLRERLKGQTTLSILIRTGYWSIREAAAFCGSSKSGIGRKILKETSHYLDVE